MNKQDYIKLGEEYLETSDRLMERVDQLKLELKTATGSDAVKLERRIVELGKQNTEMINIGNQLLNYYRESSDERKAEDKAKESRILRAYITGYMRSRV